VDQTRIHQMRLALESHDVRLQSLIALQVPKAAFEQPFFLHYGGAWTPQKGENERKS